MYFIIYLIISLFATLITAPIFQYSDKFVIFLLFFWYGMSSMSFSFLIASLFHKARTATMVGVVVYFVSYFSLFSVDETTPQS
mmetsp:Transcript_26736/g.4775  ORF Transcript_26736/g.4775 Transcript_26736/m.4775 type:complete len:83 (+) Transcript_26736:977-1225(+)